MTPPTPPLPHSHTPHTSWLYPVSQTDIVITEGTITFLSAGNYELLSPPSWSKNLFPGNRGNLELSCKPVDDLQHIFLSFQWIFYLFIYFGLFCAVVLRLHIQTQHALFLIIIGHLLACRVFGAACLALIKADDFLPWRRAKAEKCTFSLWVTLQLTPHSCRL